MRTACGLRLAACGLVLSISFAASAKLTVTEYRSRLQSIEQAFDNHDDASAARAAKLLMQEKIEWDGELLAADATVLEPIAEAEEGVRAPLRALIAGLGQAGQSRGAAPDAAALDRLRARQEVVAPQKGGALPGAPIRKLGIVEQFLEWMKTAASWIYDRLRELWHWLRKWWPKAGSGEAGGSSGVLNPIVFVIVGLIVALVAGLAVRAARQRRPEPSLRAPLARRDADEDPLSRAASEWEDRARELQVQGRFREAIRAWYHALLVSSFRAGQLHHRRGRTNWEYARALPELPWRGRFLELTGRFDLEWYGRAESSREAAEAFGAQAEAILAELVRRAA